jgi:hypothetical protein
MELGAGGRGSEADYDEEVDARVLERTIKAHDEMRPHAREYIQRCPGVWNLRLCRGQAM